MIVIEIKLISAINHSRDSDLGTLVIDNITRAVKWAAYGGKKCDYRGRMYRKGALAKYGSAAEMVKATKYTRECVVENHQRLAEPVQNLVAKALTAMGYG